MYCVEYKDNYGGWTCTQDFIFFWRAITYTVRKALKTDYREWRIMGPSKDYRQIDFVPVIYITRGED